MKQFELQSKLRILENLYSPHECDRFPRLRDFSDKMNGTTEDVNFFDDMERNGPILGKPQ